MNNPDPGDWHKIDIGTGRPLVLLHGGGSSSDSWRPVLGELSKHRRVIAFDIPGHGRTPAPQGVQYDIDWLFDWVVPQIQVQLERAGIQTPVDLAGNSMGGWIALEAAKRGLARSVVALGPAGLWETGMPPRLQNQFRALLIGASALRGHGRHMLRLPLLGQAALYPVVANPGGIPREAIIEMMTTFDHNRTVLVPLLRASRTASFHDGRSIDVPITIAHGTHDRMVHPPPQTIRDRLPAHTRWLELPGCGHVPMSDDPALIARTILEATTSTETNRRRADAA
jgi:pimeloyl-ACP methyl ester carboxylesterase